MANTIPLKDRLAAFMAAIKNDYAVAKGVLGKTWATLKVVGHVFDLLVIGPISWVYSKVHGSVWNQVNPLELLKVSLMSAIMWVTTKNGIDIIVYVENNLASVFPNTGAAGTIAAIITFLLEYLRRKYQGTKTPAVAVANFDPISSPHMPEVTVTVPVPTPDVINDPLYKTK